MRCVRASLPFFFFLSVNDLSSFVLCVFFVPFSFYMRPLSIMSTSVEGVRGESGRGHSQVENV